MTLRKFLATFTVSKKSLIVSDKDGWQAKASWLDRKVVGLSHIVVDEKKGEQQLIRIK